MVEKAGSNLSSLAFAKWARRAVGPSSMHSEILKKWVCDFVWNVCWHGRTNATNNSAVSRYSEDFFRVYFTSPSRNLVVSSRPWISDGEAVVGTLIGKGGETIRLKRAVVESLKRSLWQQRKCTIMYLEIHNGYGFAVIQCSYFVQETCYDMLHLLHSLFLSRGRKMTSEAGCQIQIAQNLAVADSPANAACWLLG